MTPDQQAIIDDLTGSSGKSSIQTDVDGKISFNGASTNIVTKIADRFSIKRAKSLGRTTRIGRVIPKNTQDSGGPS